MPSRNSMTSSSRPSGRSRRPRHRRPPDWPAPPPVSSGGCRPAVCACDVGQGGHRPRAVVGGVGGWAGATQRSDLDHGPVDDKRPQSRVEPTRAAPRSSRFAVICYQSRGQASPPADPAPSRHRRPTPRPARRPRPQSAPETPSRRPSGWRQSRPCRAQLRWRMTASDKLS
jgi:hypothetical protein